MFMHSFYAYVPFLFYLSVLGCDCIMFFFSLSDRLRMAPKRKSTLTRNPFCSGLSSSSNPPVPPLYIRFRDEKAHQDFSENFPKCGVHPEHHVILSDFSDTPLSDVINTRGWKSLCEILGMATGWVRAEFFHTRTRPVY